VNSLSTVFAKRLKEEREKNRWTQEYFASLLGVSNGTISGYERNYREPDIDTLIKISDLLSISIDYLTGKSDIRNVIATGDNVSADTLSERIAELPEDKRKTIETLLKVYEMENNNENAATSSGK
jgi:transcriptional regulator with XRE-family HTH domain